MDNSEPERRHTRNSTIPPWSITTTNIFGLACGTYSQPWGWPHRIDNSLFVFVNKQLSYAGSTPIGFVLDAKAENPASATQLRQMLQKLLAE
jgi:hypothetical protein